MKSVDKKQLTICTELLNDTHLRTCNRRSRNICVF